MEKKVSLLVNLNWEGRMVNTMDSSASISKHLRVLLADRHRLLMEGLACLLEASGIEVLGIANGGLEAISLAQSLHPDLIIMEIHMPCCDGLEATRRIKALKPDIKIVILTSSAEDSDLFNSIKSGATGYLLKNMTGYDFVESLRSLAHGIPPFSLGLAERLLGEFVRLSEIEQNTEDKHEEGNLPGEVKNECDQVKLTRRQMDVIRLVSSGMTYKEVGSQLALSERGVRYHMTEIMERLHLEHRSQVIAYAGKENLGDIINGKRQNMSLSSRH